MPKDVKVGSATSALRRKSRDSIPLGLGLGLWLTLTLTLTHLFPANKFLDSRFPENCRQWSRDRIENVLASFRSCHVIAGQKFSICWQSIKGKFRYCALEDVEFSRAQTHNSAMYVLHKCLIHAHLFCGRLPTYSDQYSWLKYLGFVHIIACGRICLRKVVSNDYDRLSYKLRQFVAYIIRETM